MADKVSETIKNTGLHFCSQYNNLVRFNPKFCAKCPHNGLKKQAP